MNFFFFLNLIIFFCCLYRELKVRWDRLDLKAQLKRKENAAIPAQLAKKVLLEPKASLVEMDHPVI
jgi:hypothetical protein